MLDRACFYVIFGFWLRVVFSSTFVLSVRVGLPGKISIQNDMLCVE